MFTLLTDDNNRFPGQDIKRPRTNYYEYFLLFNK